MTLFTPRNVAIAAAVLTGSLCLLGSARAADDGKLDPASAPSIGRYAYDALERNVRTGITRKCVFTAYWTPQTATFECAPDLFSTGRPEKPSTRQAAQPGVMPGAQAPLTPGAAARAKASAEGAQPQAGGEQPSPAQASHGERPAVVAMPTPSAGQPEAAPREAEQSKAASAQAEHAATTHEEQGGAAAAPSAPVGAQAAPVTQRAEGAEGKRSEMAPSSAAEGVPSQAEEQGGAAEREQARRLAPATGPGAAQPEQVVAPVPGAAEVPMQAARPAEKAPEATAAPGTGAAQQQGEVAAAAPQQAQPQATQGAPATAGETSESMPGAAQSTPSGAPERTPLVLPVTVTVETNPLFDFDRITIRPDSKAKLDELLAKLKGVQYAEIVAVGYADPIGTVSYNFALSKRRAQSVEDYLEAKGVPAAKLDTEGRGETEEYASLSNCGGLRREPMIVCLEPDRRVEVTVIPTSQ